MRENGIEIPEGMAVKVLEQQEPEIRIPTRAARAFPVVSFSVVPAINLDRYRVLCDFGRVDIINEGCSMFNKRLTVGLCAFMILGLTIMPAFGADYTSSTYWTGLLHEEDSIIAGILYLPYAVALLPVRLLDGIFYPQPTTQSTMPPAAHRVTPNH
ncbi:hypothetical protein ACFL2Q_06610 [Thermodesulfobacteriota bacterium]